MVRGETEGLVWDGMEGVWLRGLGGEMVEGAGVGAWLLLRGFCFYDFAFSSVYELLQGGMEGWGWS